MAEQETIGHRILKVVRRAPGCQLDDLEQSLPGLTWNQIFLEVDRLSRMGQVEVMPIGNGTIPSGCQPKGSGWYLCLPKETRS